MHRIILFSIYLSVYIILLKKYAFSVVKIGGERIFVFFMIKNMSFIDENSCLSEEKEQSPLQLMMSKWITFDTER